MIRRLVESRDILMRTLLISGLIIGMMTTIVFHPFEAGASNMKEMGKQQGMEDCKLDKPFYDDQHPDIKWREGYDEGWMEGGCKLP